MHGARRVCTAVLLTRSRSCAVIVCACVAERLCCAGCACSESSQTRCVLHTAVCARAPDGHRANWYACCCCCGDMNPKPSESRYLHCQCFSLFALPDERASAPASVMRRC
jgi:hypothetical protein